MGAHHMLGVQEVQAARDVQCNAAAASPPAERVCCAAAMLIATQRAKQVATLRIFHVSTTWALPRNAGGVTGLDTITPQSEEVRTTPASLQDNTAQWRMR